MMKSSALLLLCFFLPGLSPVLADEKTGVEPVEEIHLPERAEGLGGTLWRLNVHPKEGHFLVAKVQEFGNIELPKEGDRPLRETIRIIWTGGGGWSEDIVWTNYLKVPRTKNTDPYATRSVLSGFGQQFELGTMVLNGGGGSSSDIRMINEPDRGASIIRRKFRFSDDRKDPTVRKSIYFILQSTERMEVMSLATMRGVTLPEAGERPWSVTLPPSTEEITAESAPEKAE